jgi:hypothetical protein
MGSRFPRPFRYALIAIGIAIGVAGPSRAQPEPPRLGDRFILDRPLADWKRVQGVPGYVVRTRVSNPGTAGFRLFFDQIQRTDVPFELRVVSAQGPVDSIPGSDFMMTESFASVVYNAGEISLEIKADREPDGLNFRLLDVQFEVSGGQPFAFVGAIDWQNTVDLPTSDRRRELGRSVGRIVFRTEDGFDSACTGFLISADRLVTNRHCLGTQARCRTATIVFDFLTATDRGEQVRCREMLVADADRDMAVVRLDRKLGNDRGALILAQAAPVAERDVYLVQHPGGGPQKISIEGCSIDKVGLTGPHAALTFSHLCDTQGGSSGSPLLDAETHQVVGLHYCCFPLLPDGANRAIPIDRVREKLPNP